jgi:hypothetical protein
MTMEGLKLPPKPIDQHQVVIWSSEGNLPKKVTFTYRSDWMTAQVELVRNLTDAWYTEDRAKGAFIRGWSRLVDAVDMPGLHPTFEEAKKTCLKKLTMSRDDHEFWVKQLGIAISDLTAMTEPR